jgi:hypothetical protein
MARMDDTIWCDGCGVEILWGPVVAFSREYCCRDCLDGLECKCGERMELDSRRRAGEHGQSSADFGLPVSDSGTVG